MMDIINANLKFKNPLTPLNLNNLEFIFIHHTASITATPEQIHSWHLGNGWSGFGYNEYIRKDGTVYIGRGDNVGVHTRGYNSTSYGICCEGHFDREIMPEIQFQSLVKRCKIHFDRLKGKPRILGHGAVNQTSCPGKNFPIIRLYDEMSKPEVDKELEKALDVLMKNGIINSPDYWKNNALKNKKVEGEFVNILIKNVGEKVEIKNEYSEEFYESQAFLEKYNEPTEYVAMTLRFRKILENIFETSNFSREQLRHILRR